jgi:proteic killer suppression protein
LEAGDAGLEYLGFAAADDLQVPPSNQYVIAGPQGTIPTSVNNQWRICFRFKDGDV